jgi:hypothetical protein
MRHILVFCIAVLLATACDGGSEPSMPDQPRSRLGGACGEEALCAELACDDAGACFETECRSEFASGACLIACTGDLECPAGTACATLFAGNFCVRRCTSSDECNIDRPPGAQAECDRRTNWVEPHLDSGCKPPRAN